VGIDTVLEVGDSQQLTPVNYTIAVQREKAIFFENEIDFSEYEIFSRPLAQPVIHENFRMTRINETSHIVVHKADVFLLSSAAIVHVGSSQKLYAQSRIKHIRHLLREKPKTV
jgi:spore germination protein PE